MSNCVIVVYTPIETADAVRAALAQAGAGAIGDYTGCSFSSRGIGRFTPRAGANPTIGAVDRAEEVPEERIEVICPRERVAAALDAMIAAHPYEEPAYHVLPVMTRADF
ncbi:hypothetical protein [Brevibacterium otitidis]|uniref:NGG1p interacting factor NIF3 n=1 Tax=Brevibacterium otitidis TaxID=53364 RepID=A0ABV5X0F2_9MICO|nr:hypothetical protein GCM10023233_14420 [Brevibacterium otitidis]